MLWRRLQRAVELTVYPIATGVFMVGWLCFWPVFNFYRRHSLRA
jgi:hypothetical protein